MRISRPVIYLLIGAAVLVVSASIVAYDLGRSSIIGEVVTTTSVSTVSTTKTVTTSLTSLPPSSTTTTTATTTITSTSTAIIGGNVTATTITTTITSTSTITTTAKTTNTTSITKTSFITTTTTYTTTTTLTTTIPAASSFRFVVMGDSRGNDSSKPVNTATLSKLTTTANSFNPAFALFTGDLCIGLSQGGCPATWKSAVDSRLLAKTVPVRGNHDGSNDALWLSNFNIASIVSSFGGTRYNYRSGQDSIDFSFDYGNSHFVGLSVVDDLGSIRPSANQLNWLDADLTEAEKSGCGGTGCQLTFIEWHAPVYCVSPNGGHCSKPPVPPPQWTQITNAHPSIAAIFQGHEHVLSYAHIDSSRISGVSSNREYEEFIMGGAGAPLYSCGPRADWCISKYGFAVVDVFGLIVIVQVYGVDGQSLSPAWVFRNN